VHRDFVRAGSDVVEALTYYGHREKLRSIGKEDLLEPLNRQALAIARRVAEETGTLFAGNISNTNIYEPADEASDDLVRSIFREQVQWTVEEGADFLIAETFSYAQEALLALEVAVEASLPTVVTLVIHRAPETREGWSVAEACRRLEDAGAAVVGLNCSRGPQTMLPLLEEVVEAISVPVAALPVPYRTTEHEASFQSLQDPSYPWLPADRPFPTALDPFTCNRYEIADFTRAAHELGVRYLGLCCGAGPHHIRAMAEALGRTPPASFYSADMSQHAFLGNETTVSPTNRDFGRAY
jgi:betaine-homocysteine S-methyltransferase